MPRHPIADFLTTAAGPILDVRAPAEYAQGHIPGALSLPLFTDEERARLRADEERAERERSERRGDDTAEGTRSMPTEPTREYASPDEHGRAGYAAAGQPAYVEEQRVVPGTSLRQHVGLMPARPPAPCRKPVIELGGKVAHGLFTHGRHMGALCRNAMDGARPVGDLSDHRSV